MENREAVRKLNKFIGLLKDFESNKIIFSFMANLKILDENKSLIITTNIPKLLIINICNFLQQRFGNQLDKQNIFVNPEKLKSEKILGNLKTIRAKNSEINIFVDCSKDVDIDWKLIDFSEDSSLVFIVSNESQLENIQKIMLDRKDNVALTKINYNWSHLKEESQIFLLQTKINFQNNSKLTFLDLLKTDINPEATTTSKFYEGQDEAFLKMCSDIVDNQLLNVLVDRSETLIINPLKDNEFEKRIEFLFQRRQFIKSRSVERNYVNSNNDEANNVSKIHQDVFLSEVKNSQYVLISDQAGNGKSWVMKNFTKILREQNQTRWVTLGLGKYTYIYVYRRTKYTYIYVYDSAQP